MTTAELQEALGIIADLERDCYTLKKTEYSINRKIEELYVEPIEKTFKEYCRKREYAILEKEPAKPQEPKKSDFEAEDPYTLGRWMLFIVGGIVFLPCIFILPLVWTHQKNEKTRIAYEAAMAEYRAKKTVYDNYTEHYEEWQRALESYKTLSAWNKTKSEAFRVMLQKVLQQKKNTDTVLQQSYTKCNIYNKYQNLAAVSSFYDYLAAGICTRLEGSDGAYNKYDIEMRMDRIITQLDVIIDNLEMIRDNQNKLYFEMRGASRKIDQLQLSVNKMENQLQQVVFGVGAICEQSVQQNAQFSAIRAQTEKILETSELNTYLSECNQRELHYMNRMNYLAGHYDNPYGSYAPV